MGEREGEEAGKQALPLSERPFSTLGLVPKAVAAARFGFRRKIRHCSPNPIKNVNETRGNYCHLILLLRGILSLLVFPFSGGFFHTNLISVFHSGNAAIILLSLRHYAIWQLGIAKKLGRKICHNTVCIFFLSFIHKMHCRTLI